MGDDVDRDDGGSLYLYHSCKSFSTYFNTGRFSLLLATHIMIVFYWDRNIPMLWQVSRRMAL